jgi:8-oxo-dGTP pyrophosphatase MutT (NUDIX family)
MTLLRHIAACNRRDDAEFQAFCIGDRAIGRIRHQTARFLLAEGLAESSAAGLGIPGGDFVTVSAQLATIIAALSGAGLAGKLRREMTPVFRAWGEAPIAQIDRIGLPGLGLPAYGVHVNGFVRTDSGIHLWVGRRAMDREVAPGKFDHLVAGGMPIGLTARDTVAKEAEEEAGLAAAIAARAVPAGMITYRFAAPEGMRDDRLFVYDLELPADIIPANRDGEVERFDLWPAARVLETIRATDDFKFNVNLVVIDFLIRHGILDPDREPDYAALVAGLRR